MFRSSYGLVLDTKKNLLPRIFCHEYMLCVCTNVHFCVCDFIYLVHFENIRNMIKSYEPSLIGIPLLEKKCFNHFSPRKESQAHIKYFIQFGVSPLLPLLSHHSECHLCSFLFFTLEMYEWKCEPFPCEYNTSVCNSVLTARSGHSRVTGPSTILTR